MKILEQDKIEQLLQIIQNKPAQRIVHFSDGSEELSDALLELTQNYKSQYHINCVDEIFYKDALIKYEILPHIEVTNFNLKRPRYMIQAIEYDYLIATLDWEKYDKKAFLKKSYPIIKTGGNILIFIEKEGYKMQDEWMDILEELYYVSTSIIDDIFDDYDVIVSKRMHGWGDK